MSSVKSNSASPAGWWLLVVVFASGAALMAFEIVGSRLLAPYFGNSTFVWGSLISVFLGALAGGYSLGGRVADRWPHSQALALILATSALLVCLTAVVAKPLQEMVISVDLGARFNPLVASVLLFAPASVMVGMVSPFAVRLRAGDITSLGRTAGSLYGLSTFGSIVGTLVASFWLVQSLGSELTVMAVASVLALCGLLTALASSARLSVRVCAAAPLVGVLLIAAAGIGSGDSVGSKVNAPSASYSPVFRAGGYKPQFEPSIGGTLRAKTDSSYHRIRVVDYPEGQFGSSQTRVLHFDNSLQAAARLNGGKPITGDTPVFDYLRTFELIPAIKPDAKRVLLVGLGSGALAMRLHALRPSLQIDVVEIDPKVVTYARKWFGYRDSESENPKITTYVGDGRSWLAGHDEARFDAIVLDTYFSDSIPFHLTTRQFLELVKERLRADGVVAANLVGAVEGENSDLFRSMHRTWSEVFDDVVTYPVPHQGVADLETFNNIELIASPARGVLPARGGELALINAAGLSKSITDQQLRDSIAARYVGTVNHKGAVILTDDLAPVDSLLQVDGL